MKIKTASFLSSSTDYQQCVNDRKPEIALMGRSNVGKSSLINLLLDRKKLAKVANTPGKTRLINHFLINDAWYLVDLPGYGWARVSKAAQKQWQKMTANYVLYKKNLACVLALADARLPPQSIDIAHLQWLGENQVPFVVVFTKVDKQSKQKTKMHVAAFQEALLKTWEVLPKFFIASAHDKIGREEVLAYLQGIV